MEIIKAKNPQALTQSDRLSKWTASEEPLRALPSSDVAALLADGQITLAELKREAKAYHDRYVKTVGGRDASAAFALLCQTHRLNAEGSGVAEFVAKQFAEDCIQDKLTLYQVERGCKGWRRKDTAFAPTYGQFLAVVEHEFRYGYRHILSQYDEISALIEVGGEND